MRAYNMSMATIFVNCGFAVIGSIGVFNIGSEYTGIFNRLTYLAHPLVVTALAGILAAATIVILNSNAVTDKGVAYTTFTTTFWGSFGIASLIFAKFTKYPGIEMFYIIYTIACALMFVIGLVQMPTGGQKSHV